MIEVIEVENIPLAEERNGYTLLVMDDDYTLRVSLRAYGFLRKLLTEKAGGWAEVDGIYGDPVFVPLHKISALLERSPKSLLSEQEHDEANEATYRAKRKETPDWMT